MVAKPNATAADGVRRLRINWRHRRAGTEVLRRGLKKPGQATLAEIQIRAGKLNAYQPVKEAVVAKLEPKDDGTYRTVLSFGWKRRSLIEMAVLVLDTVLPHFEFDFLAAGAGGYNGATRHLKEESCGKGYKFVVTVDIKDCFRSATKQKVADLMPFPEQVTRNVLLVGKGTEVKVKLPEGIESDSSLGIYLLSEANAAARQGLPQRSPASGLIIRRAGLGPVLAQACFGDLALYQDEVAVPSMNQAEAGAILEALKSIFSTSPVRPLTTGHHHVDQISKGFGFLGYFTRVKWGKLSISPQWRAFKRAEGKAAGKYIAAGGGLVGRKVQVLYLKRWRRSFPEWKADWWGKWYQWLNLLAGSWQQTAVKLEPPPET